MVVERGARARGSFSGFNLKVFIFMNVRMDMCACICVTESVGGRARVGKI